MIVASTSTIYGSGYLEYLLPTLQNFFADVSTITFIPYARPGGISYDEYTAIAKKAFEKIGKDVIGLQESDIAKEGIVKAEGLFTGGGNTFELVNQLYKNDIINVLKTSINKGTPYLGTSAGSNTSISTCRIFDPSATTSNLIEAGISNDNHKNPFSSNIDLYGNTGGSVSSTTYTVPIRNADGMFLDSSDNELYVIIRYMGDPSPVTDITLAYS